MAQNDKIQLFEDKLFDECLAGQSADGCLVIAADAVIKFLQCHRGPSSFLQFIGFLIWLWFFCFFCGKCCGDTFVPALLGLIQQLVRLTDAGVKGAGTVHTADADRQMQVGVFDHVQRLHFARTPQRSPDAMRPAARPRGQRSAW